MYPGANNSKSFVKCDALLLDDESRSDTYPYNDVDAENVTLGHEATVSKVSDEQLFYLQSRGLTEVEAKARGVAYEVAKFPWSASGRALTFDRTDGVTKILVDPANDRVLGVGITGAGAGELIAEAVLAMEMGATVEDIALTIHPHPTLSETLMECADAYFGHATHIFTKKKSTE